MLTNIRIWLHTSVERCHHHAVCSGWNNKSNTMAEGEGFPVWPQAPFQKLTRRPQSRVPHAPLERTNGQLKREVQRSEWLWEGGQRKKNQEQHEPPSPDHCSVSDSLGDPAQGPGHGPSCSFPWCSLPWTCLLFPCPCSSVLSISYQHVSKFILSVLRLSPSCVNPQGVAQRTPYSDTSFYSVNSCVFRTVFLRQLQLPGMTFLGRFLPVSWNKTPRDPCKL